MIKRILITVKTYPTPSTRYREIVCTGGVVNDGSWIRLYPIDYRNRDYSQWYKKYQWIEVNVEKHRRDPRPESFRPTGNIKLCERIGTENNWAERKRAVLAKGTYSMCYLKNQNQKDISLAITKPYKILNFYWEQTNKNWTPKQELVLRQISLFDGNRPLEKIPYRLKYEFKCDNQNCRGHKMMIEDWEAMELYRKMRDKFNDENQALVKVKEKFMDEICSPNKDTHFFVGTVLSHGTWIILGTFWPPKILS
jgi:hypothetical protein